MINKDHDNTENNVWESEYDVEIENTATTDTKNADKKKFSLQKTVIISIAIVLVAVLGFFSYIAFFLREPDGGIFGRNFLWTNEVDGDTYYYEFKDDGNLFINHGSIEIETKYQKEKTKDGNQLTVNYPGGSLNAEFTSGAATYTISGSRIFGNQKMEGIYGDDETTAFTLEQTSERPAPLDLPEEFNKDDALIGTWVAQNAYMNLEYKFMFNEDGSMKLQTILYDYDTTITYNGVYTIEDGVVNFTYCDKENDTVPFEYEVDGDFLYILNGVFTREGSDAKIEDLYSNMATTDETAEQ